MKSCQFLRGGENCCHGDRLGTQGVGSTSEHHNRKCGSGNPPVKNYLGHFLEKLQNIWKKYKTLPAKGAREARPFVAEAVLCTFSIFFAILPKNGPGSFPQIHQCNDEVAEVSFLRI